MIRITSLYMSMLCCISLSAQNFFLEEFTIDPVQSTSYRVAENWAFSLHAHDLEFQYTPWLSVDNYGPKYEHQISSQKANSSKTPHEQSRMQNLVYHCRNQLIPYLPARGYGLLNLVPNQYLRIPQGEAVMIQDNAATKQNDQHRDVQVETENQVNPQLEEPDYSNFIKFHPNQVKQTLQIQWLGESKLNLTLSLYSINGKKLLDFHRGSLQNGEQLQVDMNDYAPGTYGLGLRTRGSMEIIPFVKHSD